MELIKFIEKNGEEKLHELGIHFYKYGDLTVYQYSQIESFPFKRNPVVIESRGVVLDNNLKVIARPFDRFFNYGEDDVCPDINWSECHIYEKIDGSLIKIFHYNGNWHAGTKKTVYGNTDVNGFNVMFKDLVYKAFNVNTQEEFNSIFEGFEGSTLIFELTSRENRVVTSYEGTQIWLLAVRDNVTGNYIDINKVISKFKEDNKSEFLKIFDEIKNKINTEKYDSIIIYGELAGKGIQNKVAVSQIDRFFAPFSIVGVNKDTVDELDVKLSINESIRFYPVETFGVYNVQLDLDNVHLAQQEIKDLTISVENKCPVGKYFGVSGTGEGIVFTDETKQYSFKSKGEKHSVSKVKVIADVDIEKINKIKDFVDYSVTENRLNQGIEYLKEMNKELDISNIGDFLRWLANDVLKEEQDVITENGLDNDLKAIMKSVSSKGRKWFMDKINE